MAAPSPLTASPRCSRAETLGAAAWALLCAAVILLPHAAHAFRYGASALPLADGVDAPMYYILAARAPSPAEADTAYAHALFADSGVPQPRRYVALGALSWAASQVGLGGTRLLLLWDIVCPLALFWVLARWLRELGVGWGLRIAACTWFVLCHTWFVQGLHYAMRGYLDVPFLHLNRPLNPQWSLLWYATGLYLLWRYTQAPSILLQCAAGACGLYAESIQGPYLGGPFWLAWLYPIASQWRRRDWRGLALHVLWLGCAAALLKLLVAAAQSPGHVLMPDPTSPPLPPSRALLTGAPVLGGWILAALLLALRRAHPSLGFLLWAHVAVLLAAHQHVVTGTLHHPDHFIRAMKVTIPVAAAVLLTCGSALPRLKWAGLGRAGGTIVGACFLMNGVFVQLRSLEGGRATYDALDAYRQPLDWLAGQPRGVVACYAGEMFSPAGSYRTPTAVLLRTPHWVLAHAAATHFGYPVRERVARWAFEQRLRGARLREDLHERLFRPHGLYAEMSFTYRYHRTAYRLDTEKIEDLERALAVETLAGCWDRPPPFRVDYVVEGPFEREESGRIDVEKCPYLRPVYPRTPSDGADVRIFRVDRPALDASLRAASRGN